MLTSLAKIRATNNYVPNAVYIAGKYYSQATAFDNTDKTELIAELRKIQLRSLEGFNVTRATLMGQFGDEASVYRFMFLMQALYITSTGYSLTVKEANGLWYVEVVGNLSNIINALEGTSAAAGTPSISVEYPAVSDITAPTISSITVENAQPTKIVITYSESLLASPLPATGDFSVSGGKTVSSIGIVGAVLTITVNSAYLTGATITASYVPGTNKIKDAAGNLAAAFTTRAVTNNI